MHDIEVSFVAETTYDNESNGASFMTPEVDKPIVDREKFYALWQKYKQSNNLKNNANDEFLWEFLLGNYPGKSTNARKTDLANDASYYYRNPQARNEQLSSFKSGLDNPNIGYFTEASCKIIFDNIHKFVSGIDFQHLPQGFYLINNPEHENLPLVLDYSEYLSEIQDKDAKDALAINLSSKNSTTADINDNKIEFQGNQALWYAFLNINRIDSKGAEYCSENELKSAFLKFTEIVREMGLTFETPDFSKEIQSFNPVTLLGRWETVMSNPSLKICDRQDQLNFIPKLHLHNGHEAIRAITDYAHDAHPCGFLHPDMYLTKEGFTFCSRGDTAGFRIDSTVDKGDFDESTCIYWRYIAFQPERNSIAFYAKARELNRYYFGHIPVWTTTGKNHCSETPESEASEFAMYQSLYRMISESTDDNSSLLSYSQRLIAAELGSRNALNMSFTLAKVKHFKNYSLTNIVSHKRTNSQSDILLYALRNSLYNAAKFYFTSDGLNVLSYGDFFDLMYEFYIKAGGSILAFNDHHTGYYLAEHEKLPKLKIIAPHLSTFNIKNVEDIMIALKGFPENLSKDAEEKLAFCFEILNDAKNNINISPKDVSELVNIILNIKDESANWQIEVIEILEKRFSANFMVNYFEDKKKYLNNSNESTSSNYIPLIEKLFPNPRHAKIIKNLSNEIAKVNPVGTVILLKNVIRKLSMIRSVLPPDVFLNFINIIEATQNSLAIDHENLIAFLDEILAKRSMQALDIIFVRNSIVKNSDHIALKFIFYIKNILMILEENTLKSVAAQELFASLILKSSYSNYEDCERYNRIFEELVENIKWLISKHPQAEGYIFECLDSVKNIDKRQYIEDIFNLATRITKLGFLLQNGNHEVFYCLLANNRNSGIEVTKLIAKVLEHFDGQPEKQIKVFTYLSRVLDAKQSFDNVDLLLNNIKDDNWQQFEKACALPPYPSIETFNSWIIENFDEKYNMHSKLPFGDRISENTFNIQNYETQKDHFIGVGNIFTSELGKKLDQKLKDNRNLDKADLIRQVETLKSERQLTDEQILELVCLCVEILARTVSQTTINGQLKAQELNTTQIMAVYLQAVNPQRRTMSQIDTGEGKSRIMMVLAACQAAQGKTVDFLTKDIPLAERDYLTYKPFFDAVGIPTALITLNTPAFLYQNGGVNITDINQLLLLRNKSDIVCRPNDFLIEDETKRCLLLDEADVFIHDNSKDSHNYAARASDLSSFVWIYPHAVQFVLNLNKPENFSPDHAMAKSFVDTLNSTVSSYENRISVNALLNKNPEQIITWLRSAHTALKMKPRVHYLASSDKQEDFYIVRDAKGRTRRSRKIFVLDNGRVEESSTFSYGVHQCLCAIENETLKRTNPNAADSFVILPENRAQRSSYPVNFLSHYANGSVYCASGTARSEDVVNNDQLNVEKLQYFIVPREKRLIRKDEHIWLAKDESQQLLFISESIKQHQLSGGSVVIICKDDEQAFRFNSHLLKEFPKIRHAHGLTKKADELEFIRTAGVSNNITLSTSGMMGRGVDINADNMLVLCAYVPPQEDEHQIKGRTGRFGKTGVYRMIPNRADLDNQLNRVSYNVHNDVLVAQHNKKRDAIFEEKICTLYAIFQEEITRRFLDSYRGDRSAEKLKRWEYYLKSMLDAWDVTKRELMVLVEQNNLEDLSKRFSQFTVKQLQAAPIENKGLILVDPDNKLADTLSFYRRSNAIKRAPIQCQSGYDVADDGQARIYMGLFTQTRATLSGTRPAFANFRAYCQGRGVLFADFRALLNGERPLLANLWALISYLTGRHQSTSPAQTRPQI